MVHLATKKFDIRKLVFSRLLAATAVLSGCGLSSEAFATSNWCGVYDNSTDRYLNLRAAPSHQYRIVGRVVKSDLLGVAPEQCRDYFPDGKREFGRDICPKNRWVFVETVFRKGGYNIIKGWANSAYIRRVGCPDGGW
jgi:hypothetical protein